MVQDAGTLLPCPLCSSVNIDKGTCYVESADPAQKFQQPAARCRDCGCRATLKAWNTRQAASQGIVTADERQMIREKTGWECCNRCDSPIACAKDCCCARFGDEVPSIPEAMQLAAEYEAGLRKMEMSGYEEFSDTIPKHKLVIKALRALTTSPVTSTHGKAPL